ncbi:hypothetical protein N7468_002511 [Penicillium chermesinum]|uniref:Uncharacterized protein n=1 Tax=Penicillium chermesinum TaxID=63820 RepID=A0A9W9PKS7_9EURO|nr:uncharacterized protein N7468_002511 [Penicillium chermesinum]KAJ5247528.1 hypothetical protein N7468_002511 [Penicillium chermesinum]
MTREQLQRFLTWIETLPPGYTIELDAIYPTTSTLLIFQSAYALFVNLAGVDYLQELITDPAYTLTDNIMLIPQGAAATPTGEYEAQFPTLSRNLDLVVNIRMGILAVDVRYDDAPVAWREIQAKCDEFVRRNVFRCYPLILSCRPCSI